MPFMLCFGNKGEARWHQVHTRINSKKPVAEVFESIKPFFQELCRRQMWPSGDFALPYWIHLPSNTDVCGPSHLGTSPHSAAAPRLTNTCLAVDLDSKSCKPCFRPEINPLLLINKTAKPAVRSR